MPASPCPSLLDPSLFGHVTVLPVSDEDHIRWLQLIRSHRVGPATFVRLLADYGTVEAALAALPGVARGAGVTRYSICPYAQAEREYTTAIAKGFRLLCLGSPLYPDRLAEIPDAPPALWAFGNLDLLKKPLIALVGARNASSLGTRMARALARDLGEMGYAIVSGLARGIDASAHLAALERGTVAVQAGGLDVIYPAENTQLHHDIGRLGLRLSEQAIGMAPQARHFPQRNRIIAGLTCAVLVVEGAARSGSLITARNALEQGREVMAVPGNPLDGRAAGCNRLIRDGAVLVRTAEDVAEALARPEAVTQTTTPPTPPVAEPKLSIREAHARILGLLGPTGVAEDAIIRDSGLPAQTVSRHLLDLELDGQVERQPGGLLALTIH
jgi:DNA processing protein